MDTRLPKVTVVTIQDTKYVVDDHFGKRQLEVLDKFLDRKKYKIGDSIESVAYKQGQQDLRDFIFKNLIGGKL